MYCAGHDAGRECHHHFCHVECKVLPAEPWGGLILTTSLWPKPCAKKLGDYINQLSIINKVCIKLL